MSIHETSLPQLNKVLEQTRTVLKRGVNDATQNLRQTGIDILNRLDHYNPRHIVALELFALFGMFIPMSLWLATDNHAANLDIALREAGVLPRKTLQAEASWRVGPREYWREFLTARQKLEGDGQLTLVAQNHSDADQLRLTVVASHPNVPLDLKVQHRGLNYLLNFAQNPNQCEPVIPESFSHAAQRAVPVTLIPLIAGLPAEDQAITITSLVRQARDLRGPEGDDLLRGFSELDRFSAAGLLSQPDVLVADVLVNMDSPARMKMSDFPCFTPTSPPISGVKGLY